MKNLLPKRLLSFYVLTMMTLFVAGIRLLQSSSGRENDVLTKNESLTFGIVVIVVILLLYFTCQKFYDKPRYLLISDLKEGAEIRFESISPLSTTEDTSMYDYFGYVDDVPAVLRMEEKNLELTGVYLHTKGSLRRLSK